MTTETLESLKLLRKPFPANQISYLPKGGTKLAYVGHAALTDRLLDADPAWVWEPLAISPDGLPVLDGYGGMWIRLTVCGVTRLGYGHAGTKEGGDAIKEVIGDALRNAAMRFGAALDLWHKGELHAEEPAPKKGEQPKGVMGAVMSELPPLSTEDKDYYEELADQIKKTLANLGQAKAFDRMELEQLDNEQKLYLNSFLDPKTRSALKVEKGLRIGAG